MQQAPGPLPPSQQPDPGALALHSVSELGEVSTIATAQLIGGLSGLLVSEGLSRMVREILGVSSPPPPAPPPEGEEPSSTERPTASAEKHPSAAEGDALAGLSAKALKELVAQGVAGRIIALNSVNTYLSLATAEQLRRIGTQLTSGEGLPPAAPKPAPQAAPAPMHAPPAYPYPGPVYWSQVPPGPYRWR